MVLLQYNEASEPFKNSYYLFTSYLYTSFFVLNQNCLPSLPRSLSLISIITVSLTPETLAASMSLASFSFGVASSPCPDLHSAESPGRKPGESYSTLSAEVLITMPVKPQGNLAERAVPSAHPPRSLLHLAFGAASVGQANPNCRSPKGKFVM